MAKEVPGVPFNTYTYRNVYGREVRLHAVQHVAPAEWIDALHGQIESDFEEGFQIHVEGVRGVPSSGLNEFYEALASMEGMKFQGLPTVPYEVHDATYGELSWFAKAGTRLVSSLGGRLIRMIKGAYGDQWREVLSEHVGSLTTRKVSSAPKVFLWILGGVREVRAVEAVMAVRGGVSMVWGAAHVPSFTKRLRAEGFELMFVEDMVEDN